MATRELDKDEIKQFIDNDSILSICNTYRGISPEDLNQISPYYSCVICANIECTFHNKPGCCCEKHSYIKEDAWAKFYNF
jgi:hypothetical protein